MGSFPRRRLPGWRFPKWGRSRHRAGAWSVAGGASLLLYLTIAIGVPLPFVAPSEGVGKSTDQPFPCMHRACGCRSAEQCWRRCCCHSPQERLVWAERRGITIPAPWRVALVRAASPVKCPACCARTQGSREAPRNVSMDRASPNQQIRLIAALECRGLGAHGSMGGPLVLPVVAVSLWMPAACDCCWQDFSLAYRSLAFPPATRPPRAASV